jgi:hypothetical protein
MLCCVSWQHADPEDQREALQSRFYAAVSRNPLTKSMRAFQSVNSRSRSVIAKTATLHNDEFEDLLLEVVVFGEVQSAAEKEGHAWLPLRDRDKAIHILLSFCFRLFQHGRETYGFDHYGDRSFATSFVLVTREQALKRILTLPPEYAV